MTGSGVRNLCSCPNKNDKIGCKNRHSRRWPCRPGTYHSVTSGPPVIRGNYVHQRICYAWHHLLSATPPSGRGNLHATKWAWQVLFWLRERCTVSVRWYVCPTNFKLFSLLKTASKRTQTYNFGDKNGLFVWGGGPATSTTPHPLDSYGASPPPYWNPKYATDSTQLTTVGKATIDTCSTKQHQYTGKGKRKGGPYSEGA